MKRKTIVKIAVDILMTILLFLQMAYYITGEEIHEWIGTGMFVLFFVHLVFNRDWLKSLHKGRYSAYRVFQIVLNLLLLVCIVGLIISGVMLSMHVFSSLMITDGMGIARTIHYLCAYWSFVLMSIHIGQHWGMILGMTQKATKTAIPAVKQLFLLPIIGVLIAGYGVYALIARQIPQYLFLQSMYSYFDYNQPTFFFFLEYFSIMGLFVFFGHYTTKLIRKKRVTNKVFLDVPIIKL